MDAAPARTPIKPDGFTLIELLVALSVLSIAAMALIKLMSASLLTAGGVETRALGGIVAENLGAEALTDYPAPALGKDSGTAAMAGRNFAWTRNVAASGETGMIRIDLAVAAEDGSPAAALTLFRGP